MAELYVIFDRQSPNFSWHLPKNIFSWNWGDTYGVPLLSLSPTLGPCVYAERCCMTLTWCCATEPPRYDPVIQQMSPLMMSQTMTTTLSTSIPDSHRYALFYHTLLYDVFIWFTVEMGKNKSTHCFGLVQSGSFNSLHKLHIRNIEFSNSVRVR